MWAVILSMTVIFSSTSDGVNVLNKTITDVKTKSDVKPFEPCNMLTPKLLMAYDADILACNHCRIDTFGRSYYITNIILLTAEMMMIECNVDVLTTYKDSIKNVAVSAVRSESVGSNDVIDTKYPLCPNKVWYEGITKNTSKIFYHSYSGSTVPQIILRVIAT